MNRLQRTRLLLTAGLLFSACAGPLGADLPQGSGVGKGGSFAPAIGSHSPTGDGTGVVLTQADADSAEQVLFPFPYVRSVSRALQETFTNLDDNSLPFFFYRSVRNTLYPFPHENVCKTACKWLDQDSFWSFERGEPIGCTSTCTDPSRRFDIPNVEALALHAHEKPYELKVLTQLQGIGAPSLMLLVPIMADGETRYVPIGGIDESAEMMVMQFSSIVVHPDYLELTHPASGARDNLLEADTKRYDLELDLEDYVVAVLPPDSSGARPYARPYPYNLYVRILSDDGI